MCGCCPDIGGVSLKQLREHTPCLVTAAAVPRSATGLRHVEVSFEASHTRLLRVWFGRLCLAAIEESLVDEIILPISYASDPTAYVLSMVASRSRKS